MRLWLRILLSGALGFMVSVAPLRADDAMNGDVVAAKSGSVPAAIAGSHAGDYVGQDVTIEGRVAAIHESPLATVLAFAPNFAGFTATILAADRDKFPTDLSARVRDQLVRVNGTVTAYRGKPEMALHDPSQLILAPPPAPGSVAAAKLPAPAAPRDGSLDDIRRSLARIEGRLEVLEGRLNALDQGGGTPDDGAAEPRQQR